MNMDFEQLLKQEVQKAARQDYEEITAKAQAYPYKFSKEFNEKMKGIIREEKKKAKKKRRVHILLVAAILLILNAGIVLANDDLREKVGTLIIHFLRTTSISMIPGKQRIPKNISTATTDLYTGRLSFII